MLETIQQIDEVVVVGYGTAKKSDLTGSVASVTSTNFRAEPVKHLHRPSRAVLPEL